MKKLAAILCLSALTTGAFAQGLVNFFNNTTTLVSSSESGSPQAINGTAGQWYFGLLTAAAGTTDPTKFTFAGAYATNQAVAGRFFGGAGVKVAGWAAGASMAYEIAGWSSSLGPTFNSAWLTMTANQFSSVGVFGLSGIGTGAAGGATGTGTLPNYNLFGGTGLTSGFNLSPVGVPEPTSMALAGLGAAALLIFRRRK